MQLSPVRQAELHSDLKIQEKDELQWKKLKVEGLDENGEREAQLRRNFNGETASVCGKVEPSSSVRLQVVCVDKASRCILGITVCVCFF